MVGPSKLMNVREIFEEESSRHGLKGVLGVAAFNSVYGALLPVQRRVLNELCGADFRSLMERGSIISVAYAYPESAIDAIAVKEGDDFNKKTWNTYASEYSRLNDALDATTERFAEDTEGTAIPATVPGVACDVRHVEDYYGMAISHRVVAEQAGIGWRGKNELIVNPQYSCAIRLASVIVDLPLERTPPSQGGCGNCRACLDACTFLLFKDKLVNYREQCRRYIVALGLDGDVCGKCIKACYRDGIHRNRFKL